MLGLVKLKEDVNVKSSEIDLKDKTIAVFPLTVYLKLQNYMR